MQGAGGWLPPINPYINSYPYGYQEQQPVQYQYQDP
jgi:hypothetical protein